MRGRLSIQTHKGLPCGTELLTVVNSFTIFVKAVGMRSPTEQGAFLVPRYAEYICGHRYCTKEIMSMFCLVLQNYDAAHRRSFHSYASYFAGFAIDMIVSFALASNISLSTYTILVA